jgi:hypothetical protein
VTTISVTAEHIAEGVRCSCSRCPVALAIADAFPGADVWVGGASFDITFEDAEPVFVDLPSEAEDFIGRFDEDGFGEPFSFDVDYPAVTP